MEINRCPECGRVPIVSKIVDANNDFLGFQIDCDDCCLHTGCTPFYEDAVAKWNALTNNLAVE
jgi:hypothetical protein